MDALKVIIGPIITEKSMNEASKGRYTFKVFSNVNKTDIRKAVEDKFKVNVLKTTTVVVKGRRSRRGTRRVEVLNQAFKKAIVTLKAGQKIALFDTGSQK
nr:50S ribosomal protein L23 [Candidatus Levybacteria bacterium]